MPLQIVCVQSGNYQGRGAEYVNVLFDSVRRNLAEGHKGKFVCFTDDPEGLEHGIEARALPTGLRGWWNKLYLFKDGLFDAGDRIVYFDLDTLITGRLDEIVAYQGEFAILRDAYRPDGLQSSVMLWEAGKTSYVWDQWELEGRPEVDGGDQAWIERAVGRYNIIQEHFPDLFISYKASGREAPHKASVVFFHGEPRPHQVLTGWVPRVWKIDGISRADLDVICNTENALILDNMKSACERDLQWFDFAPEHEKHVCIVGGGPSLNEAIPELRAMLEFGHELWALNGAYDYLVSMGIQPDVHVLLDAREGNTAFVGSPSSDVEYLVASQCHPKLLDALAGFHVTLYHNNTPGAFEFLKDFKTTKPTHLFNGGTTVGMKAMVLARKRGFKNFHLYGFDSSYAKSEGHAYAQPSNDGEVIVEAICGERHFKCAPWMVTQVQDFQVVASDFANEGCTIVVAGDGLLPHMARLLGEVVQEGTAVYDGVMWPLGDLECRPAINAALRDADVWMLHAKGRKVVVQAGGNVGLIPKKLSQHFEAVWTFEPDEVNFQCLKHNVTEENVVTIKGALGERPGKAGMVRTPRNVGAHYMGSGSDVEVLSIDELDLPACDLLQLDIEGFELPALKGAEQTIRKFKPAIVLEMKGLGSRYGITNEETDLWVKSLGYREVDRTGRDVIYTT